MGAKESSVDASHARSGDLLVLSSRIKASIGEEAFAQSWIDHGELHVAVVDEVSAASVSDAGAVAHLVRYSEAELMEAARAVMTWAGAHSSAALGAITLDALEERVVVGVEAGQQEELAEAFDAELTGGVDVVFEGTGGPAGTV